MVGTIVALARAWQAVTPRGTAVWNPWPDIGRRGGRLAAFAVVPLAALLVSSPSSGLLADVQESRNYVDMRNFYTWYPSSKVSVSLPPPILQVLATDQPGKLVAHQDQLEPLPRLEGAGWRALQ